jgi:hypothetical protein
MKYQATCLGLLVDQYEGFDFNEVAKKINEITEGGQLDVDFRGVIAQKLINGIVLMERILNQPTGFDVERGDMPNINNIFGENLMMS